MTIATFSASRLYAQRVLRPETAAIFQLSSLPRRPDHCRRVVRRSPAEVIVELLLPFLTLLGTVTAMSFVTSDGWFQLCGLWS